MKMTSYDVARRAGVSQSAVSRHYSGRAGVSEGTAKKIREAAKELGYRPNAIARSLITGQSRLIGLVVSNSEGAFLPQWLGSLSGALHASGYNLLLSMRPLEAEDVDSTLQEFLDHQVDGIVAVSIGVPPDSASRCHAAGIPVVSINRRPGDDRLSAVVSDDFTGGLRIAELFLAGGHRRIALIAGNESDPTARDREAGFRAGLSAGGATLFDRSVGNFDPDEAGIAARRLFSRRVAPDAVFAANDHMAFAVMDVLRYELGLNVPEDVSVAGFGDVPAASWQPYGLTTMRQPIRQMVAEAVSMLLAGIGQKGREPRQLVLPASLVLRNSCRASRMSTPASPLNSLP